MTNKKKKQTKAALKIDFHGHTEYSRDCLVSLDSLRKACLKKGILPCITDHNTIAGALEYQRKFGKSSCIVGEEIKTKDGEIIGLYMKEEIPAYLTPEETLKRLAKQGAIITIPHPFDRMRNSRLKRDIAALSKKHKIDVIEVFNSRTLHQEDNKVAESFARKNKFPVCVGSDWHTTYELGRSYLTFEHFDVTNKKKLLELIKAKKFKTTMTKSTILVHVVTKGLKILGRKGYAEKNAKKNKRGARQ